MQNWQDIDFDSTVKAYDYTKIAAQKMTRLISSEEFEGDNADRIYQFLFEEMELVSFKDYLKRYLYERSEIHGSFRTVEDSVYEEIISQNFTTNNAPRSFETTKKRWNKTVHDWVSSDSVKRNTIFLLGFGLRMSNEDVTEFLTKVLKEEDFDYNIPEEVVYWYCFHEGLPYSEAKDILDNYEQYKSKKSLFHKKVTGTWEEILQRKDFDKKGRQYLCDYLSNLIENGTDKTVENIAYDEFVRLYDHSREIIARMYREDEDNEGTKKEFSTIDEIGPADIEKVISCGIPLTEKGNLQKMSASLLANHFSQKRMTRHRVEHILKKKSRVDRFDLITLLFFIYSQEVEPDWPTERYLQFIDEMNDILRKCHMLELYPVNPYEAFVLMCLISDTPLAVYSEIWEISYEQEI